MAAERAVYRIEKGQGCGLGAVLGGFAVVIATALSVKDAALFWGPVVAVAVAGYFIGNAAKKKSCSHCASRLRSDATSCPKCGGIIKGTFSSAREALAAEAKDEAGAEPSSEPSSEPSDG